MSPGSALHTSSDSASTTCCFTLVEPKTLPAPAKNPSRPTHLFWQRGQFQRQVAQRETVVGCDCVIGVAPLLVARMGLKIGGADDLVAVEAEDARALQAAGAVRVSISTFKVSGYWGLTDYMQN